MGNREWGVGIVVLDRSMLFHANIANNDIYSLFPNLSNPCRLSQIYGFFKLLLSF